MSDGYLPNLPEGLRAFRHRNFRLFYGGYGISLIGTWMQLTAMGWLVWHITHKHEMLGTVWFASQIPNLIIAPFAGTLADRYNRRRLVIVTQIFAMLQAVLLYLVTVNGHVNTNILVGLALFLGVVNSFDMPIRQSFLVELVGRDDLPNAIAFNSFCFNMARVIGPPLAGFLMDGLAPSGGGGGGGIAAAFWASLDWITVHIPGMWIFTKGLTSRYPLVFSVSLIFYANAASFLAVIAALLAVRVGESPKIGSGAGFVSNIGEAVRFIWKHASMRDVLLYIGLMSLVGLPYQVLMPSVVDEVLHGGAKAFGSALMAIGLGSFLAAGLLTHSAIGSRVERIIPIAGMVFGLGLICFSLSRNFTLSWFILIPTGTGMMMMTLCSNTLLQKQAPNELRGRIMAFYTMMLLGIYPIGSLAAGRLAAIFGPMRLIGIGGAIVMLGGIVMLTRGSHIRESMARMESDAAK